MQNKNDVNLKKKKSPGRLLDRVQNKAATAMKKSIMYS
jgi:hypothetical protein